MHHFHLLPRNITALLIATPALQLSQRFSAWIQIGLILPVFATCLICLTSGLNECFLVTATGVMFVSPAPLPFYCSWVCKTVLSLSPGLFVTERGTLRGGAWYICVWATHKICKGHCGLVLGSDDGGGCGVRASVVVLSPVLPSIPATWP